MKTLSFARNFRSLSVKDLVETREAYHIHLTNLDNVTATAIGRYRMRYDDPSTKSPDPSRHLKYGKSGPRTFSNTVVKPWSWPCILVFVKHWCTPDEFKRNPDQAVPRYLYLPDGRVVPTCVIYAPPDESSPAPIEQIGFSSDLIGGGYPCFTESQGTEQIGTIGGLVTREGSTYALTARHVAGRSNQRVYTFLKDEREDVGVSDPVHISKKRFSEVYGGWPGDRTIVTLDAGLIRIEDVNQWTSQVFGIGEVGPIFNMTPETITLDLVGSPVRFFGGVSGPNEGEIYGFFYRYRTMAGFDYVADLLIGPRTDQLTKKASDKPVHLAGKPKLNTRPGDSGSFVFLDPPKRLMPKQDEGPDQGKRARRLQPLAMQWGGVRVLAEEEEHIQFALATFLSTICRIMDIDLLNDWAKGHTEYWGKIAHFKIGFKFCELLSNENLKRLVTQNRASIGFPDEKLSEGSEFRVGRQSFVPLSDVPDYVWVGMAQKDKANGPRKNEPVQHFADMDVKSPNGGLSLLDLCRKNPEANLKAEVWRSFYAAFDALDWGPEKGVLPFRVRQIYEEMIRYLQAEELSEAEKLSKFVAAAGVLAHYVGDSCIPLHLSTLNHGRAPEARRKTPEYEEYKKSREYKIHRIYEQVMFEAKPAELLSGIDRSLDGFASAGSIQDGAAAIRRIFELMDGTFKSLPPETIVESDDPSGTEKERARMLFDAVGNQTILCIAEGCKTLAELVESAWRKGKGDRLLTGGEAPIFEEADFKRIYYSPDFLRAKPIEEFAQDGY